MKKNDAILPFVTVLCVLSVALMIFVLAAGNNNKTGEFVPPAFDGAAVTGMPDVPEGRGWSPLTAGDAFVAYVCGEVIAVGQTADVYFTSPASNTVFLKLRVLDERDNVIGETGLIKPGEYVKSVELTRIPESGADIKLKIMAYEPDTYFSAGAASLKTKIS